MISFGLGFLIGAMVGVFITSICIASSNNDLDIKDNEEESNE